MKPFIALALLLSISISANAMEEDTSACEQNCTHKGVKTPSSKSLSVDKKEANLPTENIGSLSEELCGYFISEGPKIATLAKTAIVDHMKRYEAEFKNGVSPTPAQIVHFLNRNKNYMTCGRENKNYMMVSFENGKAYDQLFNVLFFDELLTDDESLYVDINAISIYRGKPETVLDFMYREYNDPTNPKRVRDEIKRLINMFEMYLNGKRYVDLPDSEK